MIREGVTGRSARTGRTARYGAIGSQHPTPSPAHDPVPEGTPTPRRHCACNPSTDAMVIAAGEVGRDHAGWPTADRQQTRRPDSFRCRLEQWPLRRPRLGAGVWSAEWPQPRDRSGAAATLSTPPPQSPRRSRPASSPAGSTSRGSAAPVAAVSGWPARADRAARCAAAATRAPRPGRNTDRAAHPRRSHSRSSAPRRSPGSATARAHAHRPPGSGRCAGQSPLRWAPGPARAAAARAQPPLPTACAANAAPIQLTERVEHCSLDAPARERIERNLVSAR